MNTGEFEQSKLFSLMALSKEMFENQEKDEKIQHLESRIKELEAKCKSEYQRGIEDGKIIAEHGTTMYQE